MRHLDAQHKVAFDLGVIIRRVAHCRGEDALVAFADAAAEESVLGGAVRISLLPSFSSLLSFIHWKFIVFVSFAFLFVRFAR